MAVIAVHSIAQPYIAVHSGAFSRAWPYIAVGISIHSETRLYTADRVVKTYFSYVYVRKNRCDMQ